MKANLIRKGIAVVSIVFGLWWIWTVLSPSISNLRSGDQGGSPSFLSFTMGSLMATPGLIATVFGFYLYRQFDLTSLKWIVGIFAAFCTLWITSRLEHFFPELLPEGVLWIVFLMIGTAVAIPAYLFILWFLLPHLNVKRPPISILIGRGILILLAWQLWLLLSSLFDEYSPIKEGYTHIHQEPWGLLGLGVPIVVAYGAYKLAVALMLTRRRQNCANPDLDETQKKFTL